MEDQFDGGGPSNQPEAAGTSKKTQLEPKSGSSNQSKEKTNKNNKEPKVFHDPIHGPMEFHPLLVKIIDTPEFQRLRFIKQLGGTYYVYPGASHNRFEHSLGVAHLAGKLVRALRKKQEEQMKQEDNIGLIDDRDILCVEIAGLCHDLGHGPYSHMFDGMFLPKIKNIEEEKRKKEEGKEKAKDGGPTDNPEKWTHEKGSADLFDHILDKYKLRSEMKKCGLKVKGAHNEDEEDIDVVFIKEMILGPNIENNQKTYKGRKRNKAFLYEIVANKRNGLDVDKFDYFARDCHHLGIKNNFDHQRFITFAKVCDVHGQLQICTRDKELDNIYEMFHTRSCLHRRAYQHKNANIIELMITEALIEANAYLHIAKKIKNMEEYTKLTECIFEEILHSSGDNLKKAREILQRVLSRQLYPYLGKTKAKERLQITEDLKNKWEEQLATALPTYKDDNINLNKDDFAIIGKSIDFGKKEKNPIDNLHFYGKYDGKNAFKMPHEQASDFLLPKSFSEKWITVYCKSTDRDVQKAAYRHFIQWCENEDFLLPVSLPPTEAERAEPKKVFNDPIHGHMEFHPLLVKIIDTPEFQRLRFIKQLGGAYYVYPGASHNRFEHSLGVAHLAGQFVRALKKKQEEQKQQKDIGLIDDRDVLCVEIAALCHDLGHVPFSIDFKKIHSHKASFGKREEWFDKMFDHLLGKNDLRKKMKDCGLKVKVEGEQSQDEEEKNDVDVVFIKEMILGRQDRGRPQDKAFLYEIVNRNGIDVDTFDSVARDCYHLGIKSNFDHQRLITFAKVDLVDDDKPQICFRDKVKTSIYDLFHTIDNLQKKAYEHKVTMKVELMISDAIEVPSKSNVEDFTKFTDSEIQNSSSEIVNRIHSRDLYRYLGKVKGQGKSHKELDLYKFNLVEAFKEKLDEDVQVKDIGIYLSTFNFGQQEIEYIIAGMDFYDKTGKIVLREPIDENQPNREQPNSEQWMHIFYKNKIDQEKAKILEGTLQTVAV